MRAIGTIASANSAGWALEKPHVRTLLDYLPAAIAAIGIVLLGIIAENLNTRSFQQVLRFEVADDVGIVRARLEGIITANAHLIRGMTAVIATEPDISQNDFNELSAEIMRGKSQIRNIVGAPDMVIRYVYPREGNEAAMGLDYNTVPAQRDAANRAKELGELVLAGPIDLVQGGQGFIARAPVFTAEVLGRPSRFWGLVSTVLDLSRVYEAAGLADPELQIEIAIRGKDASGPDGAIFYGRPEVFENAPVLADVVLPYGSWQMAAIPRGGWPAIPSNQRLLQTAFWIAGILIVMPLIAVGTLLGQRRRAEDSLVRAMEDLQEKSRAAEVSEAKFAAAFEHSPLVATISRLDTGAILDVNNAFLRTTGYERYEAIGRNSAELGLFDESQRNEFRRQMMENGQVVGMETRSTMKSGREIEAQIYSQIFAIDNTRYILTLVEDITQRKRAENQSREAQEEADAAQRRLRNAIETVNDGFVLFDRDDKLVTANSNYYRFFESIGAPVVPGQTTYEQVMRTAAKAGLYKSAIGREDQYVAERLASFRSGDQTTEQELINGSWIRVTERRMSDGSMVCSGVDITELKRREVELEHARIMADAANQAKSTFLSSMSHELRTPMNAILGFAQLLERGARLPDPERQRQYARHVLNAGNYLLELIDQVLELSKIEAGKLSLVYESVELPDVIAHSLFMVASRAKKAGVTIINRADGLTLPHLWADRSRVRQILLNFLSNAIKYNKKGGTVTVSAIPLDDKMIRIQVEDTGAGIPGEYHSQMFEPFNRLGRETDGSEGSGIGLAITKQIAEILGGVIGFKSQEGIGSSFWVDLPISPDETIEKISERRKIDRTTPTVEPGDARQRILYVEDNASNLQLMEELLGTIGNFTMTSAANGPLALDMVREEPPDLILLDINLPEMDGFEVLRRLQGDPDTKDIPVIAVTAAAMPAEVERGLSAGFKEYITKPIDIANVLRAIERQIG
ncbi:MAG: multi-sensor hybrid histidine kinase [Rhodospirillales bacterium]|nr:multi-sensor hybrid histidine kinase [Rhodospirillales bacterium]